MIGDILSPVGYYRFVEEEKLYLVDPTIPQWASVSRWFYWLSGSEVELNGILSALSFSQYISRPLRFVCLAIWDASALRSLS